MKLRKFAQRTASFAAVLSLVATSTLALCAPSQTALDLNLPNLGSTADSELSPLQEQKLGEQLMTQVRSDSSFLSDPELTEFLNHLGYTLVSRAKTNTYSFHFFPIRDSSLNAFALPGGFIAVHTGTIIAAKNESELAGVMAHEIGHVAQRHIARMIESQQGNLALTLGAILLAILAARAGGNSGGHAAAAIAMGSQAAMIQSQLNYSQDAEREGQKDVHLLGRVLQDRLFQERRQKGNGAREEEHIPTVQAEGAQVLDSRHNIPHFSPSLHYDSMRRGNAGRCLPYFRVSAHRLRKTERRDTPQKGAV